MKTKLQAILLCFLTLNLYAQDAAKDKKVPSTYDRSSITFLFLEFPTDNHSAEIKEKIDKIIFADKFYNNNVETLSIQAPFNRGDAAVNKTELVKQAIVDKKIPTDIIAKWYSRKADGTMSMDLIFERGMFNATDAAYLKAQTTKRGNASLEDYGNRLIERSYILVLDYSSILTMKEAMLDKTLKGWKATVTGYLYKINYNEQTQNALYDIWIYDDDTPQVKAEKKKKFEEMQFPVEFVTETTVYVQATQPAEGTQLAKFIKLKTDDELLAELAQKGYEESLYFLEKKYEDFRVKTPIHQVNPIRAKIGKKEGVRCDYRFFAYEYVYNEKTNTTDQKMRGVIRATSDIVDNRQVATGDMGTTRFYQTAGRKLETGYLLQQRNDFGAEVTVGYEAGNWGGVYGRVDLRLGRYIGIRSLFIYGEGGAESKDYLNSDGSLANSEGISFVHYGAGIAKGFMMTRNLELRPYVGFGMETASAKDDDWGNPTYSKDLSVLYGKGGANLALNLKHNIQVVAGYGLYAPVSKPTNEDNAEYEEAWNEIFKDRSGGSALIGIKIAF
jgi:hypothetical protein